MVYDYMNRKMLASLGYSFDPSELTDFDVSCFSIIKNKLDDLEKKELERIGKQNGKHEN